ncbi:lysophospholipid acyltransferase family protein [Novosphingobium sp. MD-1]|uniref:lysophospholipid acyltransferase family protein n=1 Tax=Novosphingobium sp. MD-1 TaxID=1630648 RepID=UPI00061C3CEB|nr:lysophospholipid acyltransferase family protein [Novosphingobium sp. MD-1]GAO54078.1 acyltransferase family protein [Novosphingobium sp. MD-1]
MPDNRVRDRRPGRLSRIVRRVLLWFYRRQGWKAVGTPPASRRCVIIAAPHTSNWDFVYFLGLVDALGIRAHFMGKRSLFRWPLGGFMRDMGGVAIDRSSRNNMVQAMVDEFAARDEFMLTIAPEGTRGAVRQWRTGFYHIALGAGVPLVCGLMDYGTKTGGLGPEIWPTGDYRADMEKVAAFYRSVTPRHPAKGLTDFGNLDD